MRALFVILFGLAMATSVLTSATADEALRIKGDGWHTWQVDEPGVSSEMCCFSWQHGQSSRRGCKLDASSISVSDSEDCGVKPGSIQVYVRLVSGEPRDIRVLGSNCPVSVDSGLTDHGLVSSAENLGWFRNIIENRSLDRDVREEALFGLVQSESDAAYAYLDALLTST